MTHPIQTMVDAMSAQWRQERSNSQMTLLELIHKLETLNPSAKVRGFGTPHSYRGYYSDLAFDPSEASEKTAHELAVEVRNCLGQTYEGYKGGDFYMGKTTPLWIAMYGMCGDKLMGLSDTEPHMPITAPDDM
jgi:hypothetical protein